MGSIFRKQYTMQIPAGAEIVEQGGKRIARWRLRNGQQRSGEVVEGRDGKSRVRAETRAYAVRYRDGNGRVVERPTKCTDAVAARAILTKLEREAELVRAGVLSPAESEAAHHADLPLANHLDAYERHLKAKGSTPRRIAMVRRRLERLTGECRFHRLNHLLAGPLETWLVNQTETGMSAATRNSYRESAVCFGNWCRRTNRLTHNPFADVPRADANSDRRHQRRALTEDELSRLLRATRLRPIAEYGRPIVPKRGTTKKSPRSRATWKRAPLTFENLSECFDRGRVALQESPELLAQLERVGIERMYIYKTLALTGLRKGELASITVAQVDLDAPVPHVILNASDEKNRKGSSIPLRLDLATDLAGCLATRLAELQQEAREWGEPIPVCLPPTTRLFEMPSGLTRIFDRDLAAAGIPKRDDRNRVVDIHALRVTFGTHLCAAGVPLRTAQAAMRHSKPELTANIYTDPRLLDIAGAMERLPVLKSDPMPPDVSRSADAG